jgi:hypothetical protein
MSASGKRGSRAKASVTSIAGDKGAQTLPDRSALMKLAKSKKTANDYSKAGPSIVQNGTTIMGETQE